MAATFTQISETEICGLLKELEFVQIQLERVREIVMAKLIAPNISLRIYTSVESGVVRDCGEDAIRIVLCSKNAAGDIKLIGTSKRVNRTQNWRERLVERIEKWEEMLGPPCAKCGAKTVERKGKFGKFWGCTNYPLCK